MKKIILSILLSCSFQANAQNWVEIDDASKLLWQMSSDGVIWFRNLNEFDPNQGSCCYAYRLDTTTAGGKSMFTLILAKMAGHQRITLGFPTIGSNTNVQTLNYIGRHTRGTNE